MFPSYPKVQALTVVSLTVGRTIGSGASTVNIASKEVVSQMSTTFQVTVITSQDRRVGEAFKSGWSMD